jgi:NADH-quinone oxidoreductase subunit L
MAWIHWISFLIAMAPAVSLVLLSFIGATKFRSNERLVKLTVASGQSIAFFCAVVIALYMSRQYLLTGTVQPLDVVRYNFFSFNGYSVEVGLQLDGCSIWFVLMATILSNLVGVFSQHYLHRDAGFYRFFLLIVLFLNGVLIVFMANTFQGLFIGWEVVGITSALLISFFTLRRETIDNALHAFWAYRVSDIGLLCGSALLVVQLPADTFTQHARSLPGELYYIVPFLFLFSAMGKSAQFPYCSWLPRAMEGPTSSSAIFYGGLSIHAGVYLLLRLRLTYDLPTSMLIATGIVGAISCVYGVLLGQVQSDVKSALAYAALSQVGIMFIEIALGWYEIAILHCLGHAFLRTYQILKSSSIIHQFIEFEDSHQLDLEHSRMRFLPSIVPRRVRRRIFSASFDLALREAAGRSLLVVWIERTSNKLQQFEEWCLALVAGNAKRERHKDNKSI